MQSASSAAAARGVRQASLHPPCADGRNGGNLRILIQGTDLHGRAFRGGLDRNACIPGGRIAFSFFESVLIREIRGLCLFEPRMNTDLHGFARMKWEKREREWARMTREWPQIGADETKGGTMFSYSRIRDLRLF
jgi:hypothetical protein